MNIPTDNTVDILEYMRSVMLDEMRAVRLMNRIDSKFVAPASLFRSLMEDIAPRFRVQSNDGRRMIPYRTQYLDTPRMDFFVMHHNGRLNRQKIRIRTYEDSGVSFLEIKNKNNCGRTDKIRIPVCVAHISSVDDFEESHLRFLDKNAAFDAAGLQPSLSSSFDRITLVNESATERITVDLNLSFLNYTTGREIHVENLMILELKRAGRQPSSFRDTLQRLRIKPHAFSKYCMGSVLTNPYLKYNCFKSKWIYINRIIH